MIDVTLKNQVANDLTRRKIILALLSGLIINVAVVIPFEAQAEGIPRNPLIRVSSKNTNPSTLTAEAVDEKLAKAERALLESMTLESVQNQPKASHQPVLAPQPVKRTRKSKPADPAPSEKAATTQDVAAAEAAAKISPSVKQEKTIKREKITPAVAAAVRSSEVVTNTIAPQQDSVELATLKQVNQTLRSELAEAKTQLAAFSLEIEQARSELMISETEVSRLSSMLSKKNGVSLLPGSQSAPVAGRTASQDKNFSDGRKLAQRYPAADDESTRSITATSNTESPLPARDTNLPLATVSVEKADLRTGPGITSEQLMTLPKGARVVVETRKGEWYRVFSPSGERAWINSSLVTFGERVTPMNDSSAARVRGYDSSLEDKAFRNIAGR